MTYPAALAELERIAASRHAAVADHRAAGAAVIAHLGADIPRPLLAAAGVVPVRLFPRSVPASRAAAASAAGVGGNDRDANDRDRSVGIDEAGAALGRTVDPKLVSIVADIVSGAIEAPVVIDHSTADHLRAHQTIGWLRHGDARPPDNVHFADLLHLVRPPTRMYNLGELRRLADWAGSRAGNDVTGGGLVAALDADERQRRATADVLALRHGSEPRLTGTQALAVVRAGWVLDAERHAQLLDTLVASARQLPAVAADRRAYVVGAAPDGDYGEIERLGLHVVGEDHDEGARFAGLSPERDGDDPLSLLADRHFAAPGSPTRVDPARRLAAIERDVDALAIDTLVVDGADAVTRWLLPALRQLATTRRCEFVEWDPRAVDR